MHSNTTFLNYKLPQGPRESHKTRALPHPNSALANCIWKSKAIPGPCSALSLQPLCSDRQKCLSVPPHPLSPEPLQGFSLIPEYAIPYPIMRTLTPMSSEMSPVLRASQALAQSISSVPCGPSLTDGENEAASSSSRSLTGGFGLTASPSDCRDSYWLHHQRATTGLAVTLLHSDCQDSE